jgi:TRAP-type C4-dicarboxylate transport system permease small subunit
MTPVDKVVDALTFLVERVLALALILGISLNFINVVGRYVAGFTMNGVDEVEIYILIWIAFLGAAVVTWRGEHLRMDVLLSACPPWVQKAEAVIETLVMFVVTAFVAWQSFLYVEKIHSLGALSDIARIPTWIPHSAITIGFGSMALLVVLRGMKKVMGVPSPAPIQGETPL